MQPDASYTSMYGNTTTQGLRALLSIPIAHRRISSLYENSYTALETSATKSVEFSTYSVSFKRQHSHEHEVILEIRLCGHLLHLQHSDAGVDGGDVEAQAERLIEWNEYPARIISGGSRELREECLLSAPHLQILIACARCAYVCAHQ